MPFDAVPTRTVIEAPQFVPLAFFAPLAFQCTPLAFPFASWALPAPLAYQYVPLAFLLVLYVVGISMYTIGVAIVLLYAIGVSIVLSRCAMDVTL